MPFLAQNLNDTTFRAEILPEKDRVGAGVLELCDPDHGGAGVEDGDRVLGEDGADDDGLLERAVALLAEGDQETLEERARLEQGLADRLEKRMAFISLRISCMALDRWGFGLFSLLNKIGLNANNNNPTLTHPTTIFNSLAWNRWKLSLP